MKGDVLKQKSLEQFLYELDWTEILKEAIESRPNAWGDHPLNAPRNAGETIRNAFMHKLREKGYITT